GADEVGGEVEDAEDGEEPVEVVEAAAVDGVAEPGGGALDERHEHAAEEEAERERRQEEPRAHRLHPLGRPRDEEVQLPRVDERLAGAHQQELRRQQEHADRRGVPGGGGDGDGEALLLAERGGGHAEDGEGEADADLLQVGEALLAGEYAAERDEDAVVDGEGEHDGADEEDGERGGRDLEAGADAAVHGGGLLHGEGDHLRVDGPEEDRRRPHRHQPRHHLHLLHARHRAELPRVGRRRPARPGHLVVLFAGHHRRHVQARELRGVRDPGVLGAVVLVELRRGGRALDDPALPRRGDEHLEDVDDGAPGAPLVAVPPGPGEEDGDGGEHGGGADAVGPAPADVVLDVDEHGDGEQRAEADEEEEAVEEEAHGGALPAVAVVELVGAEAGDAGLEAAGAEGDEVEAGVEHGHLHRRRLLPGRRAEVGDEGGGGEEGGADGLDEGEDGDGEVAAEEGVGEEAAEEAEEEGGAHEVGDDVGGGGAGEVHGARQVRHQVHRDPHRRQPLAQLDPQHQRRRHPPPRRRPVRRASPVVHRVPHHVPPAAAAAAPRRR
ncbi:Os01g0556650, partial [Oryza sativa Japonica Group]